METNTGDAGTSTINIGVSAGVPDTDEPNWAWEKSKQEVKKLIDDIKIQNEKAKIEKLEALKWLLGTEIPDADASRGFGGSETIYKSPFEDHQIQEITDKIMDIVWKL